MKRLEETQCPHRLQHRAGGKDTCVLSCFSSVQLFETLWTVAHQAPLSMGCSKQEYWSGLPCPSPGDLPNPAIEPQSLTSPALAGGYFDATWEAWERIQALIKCQESAEKGRGPRPTHEVFCFFPRWQFCSQEQTSLSREVCALLTPCGSGNTALLEKVMVPCVSHPQMTRLLPL